MIFSGTTAKMILPGCQETYGKPSSNSLGSIEASMFSAEEEHVGSSVQKNRCATAPDPWLSRSPSTAPSNCVYSLQLSWRTGGGCGWASGRGSRFEEAFNAPKIGPLATYPSRGHVAGAADKRKSVQLCKHSRRKYSSQDAWNCFSVSKEIFPTKSDTTAAKSVVQVMVKDSLGFCRSCAPVLWVEWDGSEAGEGEKDQSGTEVEGNARKK